MRTKKGRKKDLIFQGNYTKEERIHFNDGEGTFDVPQVQHIKKQPLLKVVSLILCEVLGKTVAQRVMSSATR